MPFEGNTIKVSVWRFPMKAFSNLPVLAGVLAASLVAGLARPACGGEKGKRKHFKPYLEVIDTDCPNCGWNTVELRSNGVPSNHRIVPFKKGETCPICGGRGRLMARVDWQHGHYLVEGFGIPPEDMVREYVETRSKRLLNKMRLASRRAAEVDCYRNAVALAARVRLDGDQLLGDMAQELRGHVKMFDEVGEGDWIEENVSYPFFKMQMRVPLWGAKGVVAVFYKSQSDRLQTRRQKRKDFDWRAALKDYDEHPENWEPPKAPLQPDPGTEPRPVPKQTDPQPQPAEPKETEPGELEPQPTEPKEVEPEPTEPKEEEPREYDEIIIDARPAAQTGAGVNPALYPEVQFKDKEGNVQTVYDLSEADHDACSSNGMVQYVNSNTPFEKISKLAGSRTLVLRGKLIRVVSLRVAGLNLPIYFQEGVDFTGKKGQMKKKFRYKFKAVKASGLQKANIMISARDALELKKTDDAAKILKKCKVIIISGGDIAGKEGSLDWDSRFARK